MDYIKYQQIKNKQVTVRNLIMGHVWIFQPYNNPNTNLKNNTEMGHWAQKQTSAMAIPVLWPEPCRRWVSELKRRSCESEDLEWFWMKEWSLISCQVFSDLNPVEDEWVNWRGEAVNLKIWSDSGWRNGLWSRVRCSLTSSGIIGENLELLNWKWRFQNILNKNDTINCGQCVLEKSIYFIMIFPPILNSYSQMKG